MLTQDVVVLLINQRAFERAVQKLIEAFADPTLPAGEYERYFGKILRKAEALFAESQSRRPDQADRLLGDFPALEAVGRIRFDPAVGQDEVQSMVLELGQKFRKASGMDHHLAGVVHQLIT